MNASGETLSGLELSLQALKLQVNLTTRKAKTKQILKTSHASSLVWQYLRMDSGLLFPLR